MNVVTKKKLEDTLDFYRENLPLNAVEKLMSESKNSNTESKEVNNLKSSYSKFISAYNENDDEKVKVEVAHSKKEMPKRQKRYERTDAELILRTDGDSPKVYVFSLGEDDTLIFNAERSAKIPSYRYGEGKEPQCPVPDGAVFSRSDDYWTSQLPVIDTIDHDLNGDGYPENITLTHGPTSGVNSLRIHVTDVKNEKEYSEWWGCDFGSASLSRDGDRLAVVFERRLANVGGLWAFDTVCTYLSIENDELVFETKDSSTDSVLLKYYDLEKNKQSVSQSEINAVCEKMYEMYGRTDPDTGFDYYCVVDCAFDVDGVKYYLIYWKWLVEDENGEYHHASTITNFVMSEDLSDLHGAFIEDDGTLIIYNNLS